MFAPRSLFHCYRQSRRLIQAVAAAFVLSLGVAIAAPALQTNTASPDSQVICLGNGGMKTVTFAADGSAVEVVTQHGLHCLLCAALLGLPPRNQAHSGLPAMHHVQPQPVSSTQPEHIKFRTPPARAPPASKN
jgi:hypothetical protein